MSHSFSPRLPTPLAPWTILPHRRQPLICSTLLLHLICFMLTVSKYPQMLSRHVNNNLLSCFHQPVCCPCKLFIQIICWAQRQLLLPQTLHTFPCTMNKSAYLTLTHHISRIPYYDELVCKATIAISDHIYDKMRFCGTMKEDWNLHVFHFLQFARRPHFRWSSHPLPFLWFSIELCLLAISFSFPASLFLHITLIGTHRYLWLITWPTWERIMTVSPKMPWVL